MLSWHEAKLKLTSETAHEEEKLLLYSYMYKEKALKKFLDRYN